MTTKRKQPTKPPKQDGITEADVELAERYVAAMQWLDRNGTSPNGEISEEAVALAERYVAALHFIEEADGFTEADVELAERYAAALKAKEDA